MAELEKQTTLGTREAAVLSCVNVIAAVTAQREELLAYWLDLYYQVRLAYERETHPEQFQAAPSPVLPMMRPEDVYSAVRQIWENRIERPETEDAEGDADCHANAAALARNDAEGSQGERIATAPAGPRNDAEEAPPEEEPIKKPGGWTMFKRRQVERLEAARKKGVSYAQLIAASRGRLTEATISAALNAGKLSRGEWQDITAALDDLEAAG